MRILVFAHKLEIGGTQTNAVELAAAVRDGFGHDVTLFATPGPAAALADAKKLRLIEAPDAARHPSVARIRALRAALRQESADLLHVWDWPQCFDALYGAYALSATPMLCTAMGMVVPRFLPKRVPLTFGTPELVERAKRAGFRDVSLLEPPVDVEANHPGAVDPGVFATEHQLSSDRLNLITVSRLVEWLKLESLEASIDAVAKLAATLPVRLVIVGGGTAENHLRRRADDVNRALGQRVVVLVGAMTDPRPAYAAADIVLGMGGSALRALAFEKPLIVLGERGFSEIFSLESSHKFVWQGYFGLGAGSGYNDLPAQITKLATNPVLRGECAQHGRRLVADRYSLASSAARLERTYHAVAKSPPALADRAFDAVRTGALIASHRLRSRA